MTIENGGEIDAGDGNCLVTARGTKDGLIIRMDGRADVEALQQALESFLNNRHSFLQGNEVFLEWVGAKPSTESRDNVANLFKLHGVKVFSSRGVAKRGGEQRREGEFVAHEERVAVGGGAASWNSSEAMNIAGRAGTDSHLVSQLSSRSEEGDSAGRSLFDGVHSLGLGRRSFYDEELTNVAGGGFGEQLFEEPSLDSSHLSAKSRSGVGSAKVSSMARFSQIVGEPQFEANSGPELSGVNRSITGMAVTDKFSTDKGTDKFTDRSGADRFGLGPVGARTSHIGASHLGASNLGAGRFGAGDFGFLESGDDDESDFGPVSSNNHNLEIGASKGGSIRAKALASLGRLEESPAPSASSCREVGVRLDPEAQLERAFAGKVMSSNEGFLGSDLRSSYGMEGSAWDDADARTVRGTIRSGQRIETEHSLVILGDVNSGGEIVAGGDIIVLGTLRGMAHAGAFEESGGGRVIVAMDLQPTQLRIGNVITRGGAESSQGSGASVGGVRASLGLGQAKGLAAKVQPSSRTQVGAKAASSMEIAWVEGATIVVEPYQSRGMGFGRRGGR